MSELFTAIVIRTVITLPLYAALLIIIRLGTSRLFAHFTPKAVKSAMLCLMIPLVLPVIGMNIPYIPIAEAFSPTVSAAGGAAEMLGGFTALTGGGMVGTVSLVFTAVYLIGVLTVLTVRIIGMICVRRDVKRLTVRTETDRRANVTVRYCRGDISPMAYGIFRPTIVLPGTESSMTELFYRHELAHLSHGDLYIRTAMMLIRAVYWFNPCVLLLERALYEVSESVCDAYALSGSDTDTRRSYGHELISRARRHTPMTLDTGFSANAKKMKVRLEAVMSETKKTPNKKRRIILISTAIAIVLICLLMTSMVYSTKTVTLGDVTIEIPGYWAVKRISDKEYQFYMAGAPAGEFVRADTTEEYAAFAEEHMPPKNTKLIAPPTDIEVLYSRGMVHDTLDGNVRITDGYFYIYPPQKTGLEPTYFLYLKSANGIGVPINTQSQADGIAQSLKIDK